MGQFIAIGLGALGTVLAIVSRPQPGLEQHGLSVIGMLLAVAGMVTGAFSVATREWSLFSAIGLGLGMLGIMIGLGDIFFFFILG